MSMFKKAERRKAKLKLALCGPSGSGKTFSALRIATGMGGRIAFIDTENDSGQLYSGSFNYDILTIAPPFSVDKYIQAIKGAEAEGYQILIIDSLSHAWSSQGGILDEVDKRSGNSANKFTSGWREATPMHNRFVDTILQSPLHIIATMRAKTHYDVEKDEKGKTVPVKKGMEPVQRAGLEYEFTVVLDMDNYRHMATAGKDRTQLFDGQVFVPDEDTGRKLIAWLESGADAPTPAPYEPPPIANPFDQPAAAAPAAPNGFGFQAHEQAIVANWTAAGWPINGLAQWVAARYQRQPSQLTPVECAAIAREFETYAQKKLGGK